MAKTVNKTKEFLKKCKEAGYEKVTIFIRDKRVPFTTKIKDGEWFGQYRKLEDGTVIEQYKHKVVCGCPPQRGSHPELPGGSWPKMWAIVKELGLSVGRGGGFGDSHDIHPDLCGLLTPGYYELQTGI